MASWSGNFFICHLETQARLYVKTGASWQWYDVGTVTVSSSGTVLTLNLGGVANLGDVREIGVQFVPAGGASGGSAVYVDNVTVPQSTLVTSGRPASPARE